MKKLPETRKRNLWLAAGGGILVVGAIIVAEAFHQPPPEPLVREYVGTEGAWRRVRDRGRVVTSIVAEIPDQGRFGKSRLGITIENQPNGAEIIKVTGSFDPEADARFDHFLNQNSSERPAWIAFDALGGHYEVAMNIGKRIRKEGLNTMVSEGVFAPESVLQRSLAA